MLNKEMDGVKAAERALKVAEMANNLHKQVDVERESSATLKAQVELLTKWLEDANAARVAQPSFMWVRSKGSWDLRLRCPPSLQH